jgi:hypothetical protein
MADQSVPSIQNPYDCIERVVHKLRPDEIRLVLAAINYYVVVKTGEAKQEAFKEFLAGTWIEPERAKRGLSEGQRVGLAINEAMTLLWGWLDKEPYLIKEGRSAKDAAAAYVFEEVIKHLEVTLLTVLAHFISMVDEATIATALEVGRAKRDKQRADRRASLRVVT